MSANRSIPVAISLLAIHAVLLAYSAARQSPTCDEIGHLPSGLSHWQLGRFELYRVNPPLVRLVAALPLLAMDVRTDWTVFLSSSDERPEFPVGADFINRNRQNFGWLFTVARWACLPFSLVGGFVCWKWATRLYGTNAGIVALFLWCFCPNVLANGQLITPDAGATSLGVAASYSFWRWLRHPSWSMTAITGLLLGLTELTKTTWVILFPIWPAMMVFWVSQLAADGRRVWLSRIVKLNAILILALYVLNAGYAFSGSFTKLNDYSFSSSSLRPRIPTKETLRNRFAGTWLGGICVPLPTQYLLGIDAQKSDFEGTKWSYCRGRWKVGGWYYYYLYAMLIKIPLGFLIAAFITGACSCFWRVLSCRHLPNPTSVSPVSAHGVEAPITWRDEVVLLTPSTIVLILVSSQTGFNHHLRYVLPAFPYIFIWISKVGQLIESGDDASCLVQPVVRPSPRIRILRRVVSILFVCSLLSGAISSLSIYPQNLSFFNEIVGGPANGHLHLGDSNTDWGQDLWYLQSWYQQHTEARPLYLNIDANRIDPRIVGIDYHPAPSGPVMNRAGFPKTHNWPWKNDPKTEEISTSSARRTQEPDTGPSPGWFILSVNQLHELSGSFEYFQEFEVVDRIGYSLNVYHISPDDANRLRQMHSLPAVTP